MYTTESGCRGFENVMSSLTKFVKEFNVRILRDEGNYEECVDAVARLTLSLL